MATPDLEMLTLLVAQLVRRSRLTAHERREIVHIARGLSARDAARIERIPIPLLRSRRKVLFKKLRVSGASELIATLLALSLRKLARKDGV